MDFVSIEIDILNFKIIYLCYILQVENTFEDEFYGITYIYKLTLSLYL